ncbi:unnamed protein product [Cuscuta campestris]|uniref:Uncharacterized protein n=1 Tax=Cuscuta campestris TaxID=132261 RepID=A0A484MVT1_9ASTE|nr:unnamed protein product [Cuscuta campestris]
MRKGKHILTEEPPNQLKPTRRGRSRSRAPPSTQHQQMVYVPKTLGLNTQPSQLYEGQKSKGQNTEKNKIDPKKNDFQVVHKKQFPKQTTSHSNKTSPAIENHNAKEPEPVALKQFALTPTIGLIPKPPTHEGHKHPANSQPLDVFNTFEVLQQLNMEHTGLNPKASEFHPSTIPGGREESKSKTLDDSGKAFPILPIADPDQTCGMNSSANTIPSNKGVPLAELDPGPKSGEDDIEEVWSDEGYASPIGDEDFFSSPMSEDKSKNNITEIPTDTPAANTRKGASKTKPPKPPTGKKSGKTRTSPPPKTAH